MRYTYGHPNYGRRSFVSRCSIGDIVTYRNTVNKKELKTTSFRGGSFKYPLAIGKIIDKYPRFYLVDTGLRVESIDDDYIIEVIG